MPPTEVLVFAPFVIVAAYVIFGISGFGSTLIAVPLLAHVLPLTFVVPTVLLLDCVGSIRMGTKLRANVNKAELLPLLPFLVLGLIAGVFMLLNLPRPLLLLCLGALILAYGMLCVAGKESAVRVPRCAGSSRIRSM